MKGVITHIYAGIGLICHCEYQETKTWKVDIRLLPDSYVGMQVDFFPNNDSDEWVHLVSPVIKTIEEKIDELIKALADHRDSLRPTDKEVEQMAFEFNFKADET